MAKVDALVVFSVLVMCFGVVAFCVYYSVYQGFNIFVAAALAFSAIFIVLTLAVVSTTLNRLNSRMQKIRSTVSKIKSAFMVFHRILNMHFIGVLSLIWVAVGFTSFLFYIKTVEIGSSCYLLYLGSFSLSVGILLSYFCLRKEGNLSISSRQVIFALMVIYATSLTLNLMNSVRWDVLSGADVLWEYRTARDVYEAGWWDWKLADEYRYLSSLSISILPTIISEFTGLNLLYVFSHVLPLVCSLVPVFIYLLVHQTFHSSKMAFLSAIIYTESYFTIPSFGREIKRQPIATVFLLCSLIILSKLVMQKEKSAEKNRRLLVSLAIFSFGIVVSHYTISFFFLAILVTLCLVLVIFYLFKSHLNKILNVEVLSTHQLRIVILYSIFFAALCVSWNMLISPQYTMQYFNYVSSMFSGDFTKGPVQFETEVVFDVLGPLVTSWLLFVLVLSVIGFLVLTRTQKDINKLILFVSGGFFLLLYPMWIIRPHETSWYMSLTRFIGLSFVLLCVFAAYLLLKLDRKSRSIFTVFFILLNLPMNILLPICTDYILYSQEKNVTPEMAIRQLCNDKHDFAVAVWIRDFVDPSEVISSDTPGAHSLFYADNIFAEVANASYGDRRIGNIMSFRPFIYVSKEKLHGVQSNYLFLDYYAVQYGIWYVAGPARDFRMSEVNMSHLLSFSNKIYDDGLSCLLADT